MAKGKKRWRMNTTLYWSCLYLGTSSSPSPAESFNLTAQKLIRTVKDEHWWQINQGALDMHWRQAPILPIYAAPSPLCNPRNKICR